jgi:sulfur carrier protein
MDCRIRVNKKDTVVTEGITIWDLLDQLNYSSKVAVWINGKQLLLSEYPVVRVKDGDQIRIHRIVSGG